MAAMNKPAVVRIGRVKNAVVVLGALMILMGTWSACAQEESDELFQFSTIDALLQGLYDGEMNFSQLKLHGDFGIGTFHRLDGEMIGYDGRFYQVDAEGKVHAVPDEMTTPFAAVTFFDPDMTIPDVNNMNLGQIEKYLDARLPTLNIFFAVAIEGRFRFVRTRSVPEQNKPYSPLREVTKNQPTFTQHDVRGVMVGFRCPEYIGGINVPGYHFHFLDENKDAGGHVLAVVTENAIAAIDYTSSFSLVLPSQEDFYLLDFSRAGELGREMQEAER
jgi:acetolactate decarboxylase